jgi:type IV pilus assembly protein PilA
MMQKVRGFTIIELMIVIGIIGVLASIAVPMYNDYMKRSKVSETVNLISAVRMPAIEFYISNNAWPDNMEVLGKSSGEYTSTITTGICPERDSNGDPYLYFIEGVTKEIGLEGNQIRSYFNANTMNWHCSTAGVDDDGSGVPIPSQYIPGSCRNEKNPG